MHSNAADAISSGFGLTPLFYWLFAVLKLLLYVCLLRGDTTAVRRLLYLFKLDGGVFNEVDVSSSHDSEKLGSDFSVRGDGDAAERLTILHVPHVFNLPLFTSPIEIVPTVNQAIRQPSNPSMNQK